MVNGMKINPQNNKIKINNMMTTIEPFVFHHLSNGGILSNIKILIVGENAPNPNTYFYRAWNNTPNNFNINSNPFLKNISIAIGININNNPRSGYPWKEAELLDEIVLNRGFLVIDAYMNGIPKPTLVNRHSVASIDKDIKLISPRKIIFTNLQSNESTILDLVKIDPSFYASRIAPDYLKSRLCHVFPNYPKSVKHFQDSVQFLIKNNLV